MIYSFLFSIVPIILYLIIKSKKAFQLLQQNRYNEGHHYIKWIIRNFQKIFITYDLILIPLYIISLYLKTNVSLYMYCVVYLIIIYLYHKSSIKEQIKQKLVYTRRIKRLYVTYTIVYALIIYILLHNFSDDMIPLYYLIITLLVYINYIMVYITNIINTPIEKFVSYYYWCKASDKLANMTNTQVIGITGSYGKTSSKNIVSEILNVKYNAYPTPKNYNTVNGLCNTINNYIDKFSDYFIAEMGAVKVGDIKKCCKLVEPKYGILTCIGTAHLETFGSKKNIENEKFELIESLPSDGLGILNGDDKIEMNHKIKNDVKIMTIGIDNKDVDCLATDIELSYKGTSFNVIFKGDKTKYHFETFLLGKANVYNILTGILLGRYLGISIDRLQLGVRNVKPIEHRLELKKYGDINIIDDAYNSNPVGAKMAVEVLGMMPGKKIIVTPGMIELGTEEYNANKKFGACIADNKIDEVILIGENQTKPILDGLLESKYNKKNIYILNDVKKAFPLIRELAGKETYALLENDLPDIFNE